MSNPLANLSEKAILSAGSPALPVVVTMLWHPSPTEIGQQERVIGAFRDRIDAEGYAYGLRVALAKEAKPGDTSVNTFPIYRTRNPDTKVKLTKPVLLTRVG